MFVHDVCRERPRPLWTGQRILTAAVWDSQAYGLTHTHTHTRGAHFLSHFGCASINRSSHYHSCEPTPFDTFSHAILNYIIGRVAPRWTRASVGLPSSKQWRSHFCVSLELRWLTELELFSGCITVGGWNNPWKPALTKRNELIMKSGFDAAGRWALAVQSCSCLLHILPVSTWSFLQSLLFACSVWWIWCSWRPWLVG